MPNPPGFEESDKAWYSPNNDLVGMPARGLFHSSEEYYATEFHELAHSTGHPKRLHRENFDSPVSFGSESYSKEELIAEMTAAMLCGIAGIEQNTLENSAAYLEPCNPRLEIGGGVFKRFLLDSGDAAEHGSGHLRDELLFRVGFRTKGNRIVEILPM